MHDELRDALRRVDPPDGFAARVIASAGGPQRVRVDGHATDAAGPRRRLSLLAIAATLCIAAGAGVWYRADTRRREGEEAKRQVLVSLNIAGSKLREVQMRINHEEER